MNNVNNRKMFAKRDARNKLAEMGGILASSPELLGEAQKFANGGYLDQTNPSVRRQYPPSQGFNLNYETPGMIPGLQGRVLNSGPDRSYAREMKQFLADTQFDNTMTGQSGSFSASQSGEEENENVVRAQLLQRFGDRIGDSILNTAKQLRAKARILGGVPDILASYVQEATGLVQSTLGFTDAGATSFDDAEKLRTDTLKNMGSSASDLLNLSNEGRNLSLLGGDSPRERIRRLNAQRENASQVEYEAGLPALREKLSALEGNDPMGMLSDTFVGRVQPPEGGYDAEQISSSPGQAEAIFGTGAGARFAGSGFTDFRQLAKDNPELMAANLGMLQDQDQMTNQGIVNSLDPASRAALSAQQDLTREEFLNRMPEPSGNVTPLSKETQLNTLPSEQALAEASDYNMARDIGAANEAKGINPQGPNLLPEQKEEQTYLSRVLEAGKEDISNLVEGGKKVAGVVSNVGEAITDFDKNMANKIKERRERDALNAEQNAEAKKFIDGMTEADSFNKQLTSAERDTMREEYLNRVSDDPEVNENTFINKLDGWLTSFDDAVFGRNKAAKVAEVVGEVITPDGSGLKGNTKEELDALALADSKEEIIINNNKKASSNGNVVTTSIAEDNILSSVEQGNAALDLALGGTGEVSTSTTLTQKNKEMQKLYQEMFGEDEKEVAAAKWNQLAMVGFAIAAGKDPNALTNVAAGLLQGAKQTRQDVATRKARRDKIKMSAFDAALSQTTADMNYKKAMDVARLRFTGDNRFAKAPDPSRIVIDASKAAGESYDKASEGFITLKSIGVLPGETKEDYMKRKGLEAVELAAQVNKNYAGLTNTSSSSDNSSDDAFSLEEAIKILKLDPSETNIEFFKQTYPDNLDMLKGIGLK